MCSLHLDFALDGLLVFLVMWRGVSFDDRAIQLNKVGLCTVPHVVGYVGIMITLFEQQEF